jgi:glycosyltransferase involved in cell wall biosynthesis
VGSADLIICLAPYWETFFLNTYTLKKIEIIKNTIPYPETEPFIQNIESKKLINFLFMGRIGPRKGIFDILNVVITNYKRFVGKIKVYVGGDGEVNLLTNLIKDKNLNEIIEYVGWIEGDRKTELLKKSDVYILPSYSEGLPISILEAMSYKLPIISSPVGGIPEIVKDGENGFLVAPGNLKDIENAMRFFIENPDKIQLFGQHSFRMVQPYLPSSVAEQLKNIYTALLEY